MSEFRKQSDPPASVVDGRLTCRRCGCQHFLKVVNSYEWTIGGKKRRRQCRNCGLVTTTVEQITES